MIRTKMDDFLIEKKDFDSYKPIKKTIRQEVADTLYDNNFSIVDYKKGTCRAWKSTKIQTIDFVLSTIPGTYDLLKKYRIDPDRKEEEPKKELKKEEPKKEIPKRRDESNFKTVNRKTYQDEIDDFLYKNDFYITDYKKGQCMRLKDTEHRIFDIATILANLRNGLEFLKKFNNDPERKAPYQKKEVDSTKKTEPPKKETKKDKKNKKEKEKPFHIKDKLEKDVERAINDQGYDMEDYIEGTCRGRSGKQLQKIEYVLLMNRTAYDLYSKFKADPKRVPDDPMNDKGEIEDQRYTTYDEYYNGYYGNGVYYPSSNTYHPDDDDDDDDDDTKIEDEVDEFLFLHNYFIINYKTGECREYNAKGSTKIEVALANNKNYDLLNKFIKDPARKKIDTKYTKGKKGKKSTAYTYYQKPSKPKPDLSKIPPRPKLDYIGPEKQLPETAFSLRETFKKINLYKIAESIYAVKIDDTNLRGHLFLRFQEFYENGSNLFKGKQFEVEDFINWYKLMHDDDEFTYAFDWQGYNVPSEAIDECRKTIVDLNTYDKLMFSIVDTIREEIGKDKKFYLIGTNLGSDSLLEHEIAHGLYYVYPDYKKKMLDIVKSLPEDVYERAKNSLLKTGCYHLDVVEDEIQAYSSTGYSGVRGMHKYQDDFSDVFEEYYAKIKKGKSIKMKIDFSKHFEMRGEEVEFEEDISVEDEIRKFLAEKGYTIVDYDRGFCKYKTAKNTTRIGKLLVTYDEPKLMKKFVEDPERKR